MIDDLAELPHQDADTATPDVKHAEPFDPHVERICRCVERLNRSLEL